MQVVETRLGDKDPAITLRVCAHIRDDQASGVATTFEQLITGTVSNPGGLPLDPTGHADVRVSRSPPRGRQFPYG